MSLISIIVPVYKTELYLEKCIDSLRNQSYRDIQIILVNDGSPDRCAEICDRYAKIDSRIEVVHQANAGVSNARNAGLRIAKGQYIGFVDSDDWASKEMYEQMYRNLLAYQADLSVCGFDLLKNNVPHPSKNGAIVFSQKEAMTSLLSNRSNGFKGFLCNKLFKSQIIQEHKLKFQCDISFMEDLFFCYQYLQYCNIVCYDCTPLYHYIQRAESVTGRVRLQQDILKQDFDQLKVWDMLLQLEHNDIIRENMVVRKCGTCTEILIKLEALTSKKNLDEQKFLVREIRKNLLLIIRSNIISVNDKIKMFLGVLSPRLLFKLIAKKRLQTN